MEKDLRKRRRFWRDPTVFDHVGSGSRRPSREDEPIARASGSPRVVRVARVVEGPRGRELPEQQQATEVRAGALAHEDQPARVAAEAVDVLEAPRDRAVDVVDHAVDGALRAVAVVRRDD